MTAEQALLQEHKKDIRVRYITRHFFKHSFVNTFWESKPIFSKHESKWIDGIRISINDFNYTFNCNDGELCILFIDDIKQEIPTIPEKWYLPINEETIDFVNKARIKKNKMSIYESKLNLGEFEVIVLVNDLLIGSNIEYSTSLGREEITLEQFKKYVLCECEEKHELKGNYTTGIIGSNEEKQEEKEFIEKRKDIRESMKGIGRIVSTDINGNPFPEPTNNSSFEFYSTRCWIEDRINYINKFIRKNIDYDLCIPIEWVNERNELVKKLKNL